MKTDVEARIEKAYNRRTRLGVESDTPPKQNTHTRTHIQTQTHTPHTDARRRHEPGRMTCTACGRQKALRRAPPPPPPRGLPPAVVPVPPRLAGAWALAAYSCSTAASCGKARDTTTATNGSTAQNNNTAATREGTRQQKTVEFDISTASIPAAAAAAAVNVQKQQGQTRKERQPDLVLDIRADCPIKIKPCLTFEKHPLQGGKHDRSRDIIIIAHLHERRLLYYTAVSLWPGSSESNFIK